MLLQLTQKGVPLHRVFHGIRFKVNERLDVVRHPSFFVYASSRGRMSFLTRKLQYSREETVVFTREN